MQTDESVKRVIRAATAKVFRRFRVGLSMVGVDFDDLLGDAWAIYLTSREHIAKRSSEAGYNILDYTSYQVINRLKKHCTRHYFEVYFDNNEAIRPNRLEVDSMSTVARESTLCSALEPQTTAVELAIDAASGAVGCLEAYRERFKDSTRATRTSAILDFFGYARDVAMGLEVDEPDIERNAKSLARAMLRTAIDGGSITKVITDKRMRSAENHRKRVAKAKASQLLDF